MQYKVLGVVEEGTCDRCGTNCPKRRVAVEPVDGGPVERWGVNCAALAQHGSKSARHQSAVLAEAQKADRDREYHERQKLARVAVVGQYYDFGGPATVVFCRGGLDSEVLANRLYRRTGRGLVGSYFAKGPQSEVVRVDGSDSADVSFYESRGFVPVSDPVKEVC